jgi:RimJ/RimL family protein N-acetyltransferase
MDIIQITKEQALGWVLTKPELVDRGFSVTNPRFEVTQSLYMAFIELDKLIGIVKYERFSDYAIQIHPLMDPKFWHTEMVFRCYEVLEMFFKNAGEKSLVTLCPVPAQAAIKACKKVGFKPAGCLQKAILWKGELTDMLLFQKVFK